jgi:hypothetical protein
MAVSYKKRISCIYSKFYIILILLSACRIKQGYVDSNIVKYGIVCRMSILSNNKSQKFKTIPTISVFVIWIVNWAEKLRNFLHGICIASYSELDIQKIYIR